MSRKKINLISTGLIDEIDNDFDDLDKKGQKMVDEIISEGEEKFSGRDIEEELIKEVNNFDKEFKVKTKKKKNNKMNQPSNYSKILNLKCDYLLSNMIAKINGIEIEKYKKVKFKDLMSMSQIEWNKTRRDNTLVFRMRFVSLVLTSLLGKMEVIGSRMIGNVNHSEDERMILVINRMMNHIKLFTTLLLNPASEYRNVILKINEYVSYKNKKIKHRKLNKTLKGAIFELREGMKIEAGSRFLDDDMIIDDILHISFMLATNSIDFDGLPKFKHIEGATKKHDLGGLIIAYGDRILDYEGKFNPLFEAYLESHSKVITEFYSDAREDNALLIGCYALAFARFVLNSKETDKFINEMLKKGV